MKKVKTIITSLFIILASALMTACSCAGAGSTNPEDIIHVYETGISISSTFPGVQKDDDGFLHIDCRLNDEIKITYELTPLNVTTTQVQWDIIKGDDIITCKSTVDTYSQSRTHTVTFAANRNKTGQAEILFKTTATEKITRAYITVAKNHEVLPTFVEVKGMNYIPSTGKVTWVPVTEQILYTGGDPVPAEKDSMGAVVYLEGYEVKVTNLTTGKEYEPFTVEKNEFLLSEHGLEAGNAYAIKVRALGDALADGQGANVNNGSFPKEAFKFMQLASATNIANNNGVISYQAPLHSAKNRVYYNKKDSSMFIERSIDSSTESKKDEFSCGLLNENLTEYDISIVSYPEGFDVAKNPEYVEDIDTKVRYYPSAKSSEIHIQRLETPKITFTDRQDSLTIKDSSKGDVTFGPGSDNKPYISSILTWSTNAQYEQAIYNTRFVYEIFKITKDGQTSIVKYGHNSDHSSHKEYDTQTLLNTAGAGVYKLVVYTTGNANNTIESAKVEYNFNLLDKINVETSVFEDNVFTTNQASSNIAGIDLFFVHLGDVTKSFHKYISANDGSNYGRNNVSLDLRTITQLVPGDYNIYGRFVGQKGDGSSQNTTSATGNLVQITKANTPVKVAKPVSYSEMTSDGIIKFANVDGINQYIVQVKKGSNHFVTVTVSKANGNYTIDNLYRSFSEPKYTQYVANDTTYNAINYLDLLGYAAKDSADFNQGNPDIFFDGLLKKTGDPVNYETFTFNFVSKGSEVNTGVDSTTSKSVSFQKCKPVSDLTLRNNVISFASVGTGTYVLDIDGNKFSRTYTNTVGSKIEIDLTEVNVNNTETPLIDCIDINKKPTIKVYVIGQTGSTDNNSTCLLDSNQSSQSFNVTQAPTDLFAEENGNIVWSSATSSNLRKFVLRIYDVDRNVLRELSIDSNRYTHPVSNPEQGDDPVDEASSDPNDPNAETDEYYYNIRSVMNEIYEAKGNITLAVTIQEVDPGKFTGYESDKYYVIKLPTVTLTKVMDAGKPAISASVITLVEGIKYNISIVKDGDIDNTINFVPQEISTSATSIIYTIGDKLGIIDEGNYSISLYANRDNTQDSNAQSTPFVISSDISEPITVSIQPSKIATTTDGVNLKWQSIHPDATYTIYYKKESDAEYTVINRNEDDLKKTTHKIQDIFEADITYNVKVIPSIDYVSTGIILPTDDALNDKIIKLSTAADAEKDIKTENGQLVFNVIDSSVANLINSSKNNINIIDYINLKVMVNDQKISEDTYTVTPEPIYDDSVATVDDEPESDPEDDPELEPEPTPTPTKKVIGVKFIIDITSKNYIGEKTYKIQLQTKKNLDGATGYLDSDISDGYTATKIGTATVSEEDFTKKGANIEWKLIDNATHYQLKFVQTNGDSESKDPVYVNFEYDGSTIKYEAVAGEKTYIEDSNVVKIVDGKVLYKFDENLIDNVAGDYAYTLTAFTTKDKFLNGNTSDKLTLTKLGNEVTVQAVDNNIAISDYKVVGKVNPTSVNYKISRVQYEVNGEKTDTITLDYKTGSVLFDTIKDQITYSASAVEPAADDTETKPKGPFMINLDDLGLTQAGDYTIELQFIGDDNSLLSSGIFTKSDLTRLSITTLYTHTGVITWNDVEGATSYSVKITDSVDTQKTVELKNLSLTKTTTDGENPVTNVQLLESDLKAKDFKFGINTEYTVQIMANGASLSSTWSTPFTVKKLYAPTDLVIKRYDDVSNATSLLVWNDPNIRVDDETGTVIQDYKSNYSLSYSDKEDDEIIENFTSENIKTTGKVLSKSKPVGTYTLKLKVIGNSTIGTDNIGLLTSNYSGEDVLIGSDGEDTTTNQKNPTITYVNEVVDVVFGKDQYSKDQYTWKFDGEADAYKLTFSQPGDDGEDETKYFTYVAKDKKYNFRNTELAESGYYKLTVNAVTDPTKSIVTTHEGATNDENSTELYVTGSVSDVFVLDGRLAWTVSKEDVEEFAGSNYDTVIDSIKEIINEHVDPDPTLSHLYNFRLNLNGQEITIMPTCVSGGILGRDILYEFDITNAKFDITNANKDTLILTPGYEYKINVSAVGNRLSTGTTTDGRYDSGKVLTAYKPMTPETWVDKKDVQEGVQEDVPQISDGHLLWKLVTNDDSTTNEFKYHTSYRIMLHNEIKVVGDATVNIKPGDSENDDLESIGLAKKDLVELFAEKYVDHEGGKLLYNTNYSISINVKGTEDSRKLKSGEDKFYFNSNLFSYTDVFNRLKNDTILVADSRYQWVPCEDSKATKVVIYGPFAYAPDAELYERAADNKIDGKTYDEALSEWKKSISSEFYNAKNKIVLEFLAGEDRIREYSLNAQILNSYGFTYDANVALKYQYNHDFAPGSYIIRKQELGDGRGIISTDYEDNLFVDGEPDYGVVVTKLDQMTATRSKKVENKLDSTKQVDVPVWVENGRFVWNPVLNANAYQITLMKVKVQDTFELNGDPIQKILQEDSSIIKDRGIVRNTYFDMPEESEFNDSEWSYQIVVSALRVDDKNNIVPNYFNGDDKNTLAYIRTIAPKTITVNGAGIVSWNLGVEGESYSGYGIKVNAGKETVYEDDVEADTKTFDLGTINFAGKIAFYIRALAIDEVLNSCYTDALWVTKLPNPNAKVVEGVFDWKISGTEDGDPTPNTTFNLYNENNEPLIETQEFGYDTHSYPLFTEINDYATQYNVADESFAPGQYTFTVKFNGDEKYVSGEVFNIASSVITFTANKLDYPVIESREIDDANAQGSGNRIVWNKIPNASGYRVRIIAKTGEKIIENDKKIDLFKIVTIDDLNNNDKPKFFEELSDGTVSFKLSELFKENVGTERYINSADGLDIKVYVQAIGSLDDGTNYLSSSYSNCKQIKIPGGPIAHDYDPDKGIISWELENATDKHNAILTLDYIVSNVTLEEYRNYWQLLTEKYPEIGDNGEISGTTITQTTNAIIARKIRSKDIIYRTISEVKKLENNYTLYVTDTVFLKCGEGYTPTQYQLIHTAQYSKISVVITVSDDPKTGYKEGEYQSMPYEIKTYGDNLSIIFQVFVSGDGSTLLPYQVASAEQLNSIRYFTDKHFLVTKDISNNNNTPINWSVISDEFTGSITGKFLEDSNRYPNISIAMNENNVFNSSKDTNNQIINMAFMYSIAGDASISNLNFKMKYSLSRSYDSGYVYVAGLAINNKGKIENVHIYDSTMYVKTTNDNGLEVAGMVLNNYGNIINSSVSVGTNDLDTIHTAEEIDNNHGIYALNGAISTSSSYAYAQVAGIAGINFGKIERTYFSGDITSNYIGGVVGTNNGIIDRCYSEGTANLVNCGSTSTNTLANTRDMVYGGIAIALYNKDVMPDIDIANVKLVNSYSIMSVVVSRQFDAGSCTIGGLVTDIYATPETISNNYVILDIAYDYRHASGKVKIRALMPLTSDEIATNNYYVISDDNKIEVDPNSDINKDGYIVNMTELKKVLADTTTGIYDTTVEDHPVHK